MPKERSRSAGVLWLVGLRFLILALQLINLKIAIKVLGDDAYGVAVLVATIRSLWQFVDLDIPQGLNQLLSANIRVDETRAWAIFRAGLFLHLAIGILGFVGMAAGPLYLPHFSNWATVPNLGVICLVAGTQFFFDVYGSAFNSPFNAREQFHKVAAYTSVIPVVSIVIQTVLVLVMRNPLAVLVGTLLDSVLQFVVKMWFIVTREKDVPIWPKWSSSHVRDIVKMGLKSYIAGLSTRIGGTADKLIVESVLGRSALTIYNLACRIPQILLEAFGKITESITPEMTHVSTNEPHRLAEIFRRNFRFVGFVAAVGIIFIGGFGDVILKAWMSREIEGFGILVFLMSVYYGLELHHSTITRVFFAQGKAHLMLPFTLWNSIVTVTLTNYLATRFGLVGAAGMNCFIDVMQIIPIHYYCSKFGVKEISVGELLKISFGVIGTGVAISLGVLMSLSHLTYSRSQSVLIVLAILPLCLLLAIFYKRVGLMSLPRGLEKMLFRFGITRKLFGIVQPTES